MTLIYTLKRTAQIRYQRGKVPPKVKKPESMGKEKIYPADKYRESEPNLAPQKLRR